MEEACQKIEEEKNERKRVEREEGEERKRVEIVLQRAEREKRHQRDRQGNDPFKDKSVAKDTIAINNTNPSVDIARGDNETKSKEETQQGEP